jgi:hypothetical protein
MFQWDKSIRVIDVPAGKVAQLYRSMRDVQLALPGIPAQESTAYLCQHQVGQKIATTLIFHLLKNDQLACYVNSPREVSADKAAGMLDQALMFIESMGFLMTDLDIHLLGEADRELLWSSLPLQKELPGPGEVAPPVPTAREAQRQNPVRKTSTDASPVDAATAHGPLKDETFQPAAADPAPVQKPSQQGTDETPAADQCGVDDLLAAVEALRTRRPDPRTRRKPPSGEELQRRRRDLTANLGRILASL